MRELKFRAWDKINCKMRDLAEVNYVERTALLWIANGRARVTAERVFEDIELMQFTGLKDKNGKEAYHNDLAKQGPAIYQVIWNDEYAGFYLKHVGGIGWTDGMPMFNISDCEVIGNIYENPALLTP